MMKKIWFFLTILPLFLQSYMVETQTLSAADELNLLCRFEEEKHLLNDLLKRETDNKLEIYWRLSRTTYRIGEAGKNRGDNKKMLLGIFKEGEEYADKALELDPHNADALYWKASNLGLWTQLKGIKEGLENINPLRNLLLKVLSIEPEHVDSYFFLGQLYAEVPGIPIGYGNINFAISLARKGIWLYEKKYPPADLAHKVYIYYVKMAKSLIKRNWSVKRRLNKQEKKKEKYESFTDNFKKSCFFEGTLTLENISDKEEAIILLTTIQKELKSKSTLTSLQKQDLDETEKLLKKHNRK